MKKIITIAVLLIAILSQMPALTAILSFMLLICIFNGYLALITPALAYNSKFVK
jgi:hypothetical protein